MSLKLKAAALKFVRNACKSPAAWRFQQGRPSEHLSPYYRLNCEHGSEIVALWKMGGSEPVYLCETHAEELGHRETRTQDLARPASNDAANNKSAQNGAESRASIAASVVTQEASANTNDDLSAAAERGAKVLSFGARRRDETGIDDHGGDVGSGDHGDGAMTANGARADSDKLLEAKLSIALSEEPTRMPVERKIAKPVSVAAGTSATTARHIARDTMFGDAAKALVDEAIWNMAAGDADAYRAALEKGKSPAEAAFEAGGQIAVLHRKIGEYSSKLTAVLAKLSARVSIETAIDKPLEQAMLEVINDPARGEAEKDAAIQRLGEIQEWAKRNLSQGGLRRDVTPMEAWEILRGIGERMNWGAQNEIAEELRPIYRTLYSSLREALRGAVPLARNLQDRLANLHAAESEVESTLVPKATALATH